MGERGQAELGADVVETAHQERALVHPLLDRAEGMLDDLATAIDDDGGVERRAPRRGSPVRLVPNFESGGA
jgi:hypothetical protein